MKWAAHYCLQQGMNRNLGLSGIVISWRARSGRTLTDMGVVINHISENQVRHPDVIIVHIGTNDILTMDRFSLLNLVFTFLSSLHRLFPGSVIIWSDILPRIEWRGARNQSAIDQVRQDLNRRAGRILLDLGVGLRCSHPSITCDNPSLYRRDNQGNLDPVHLSVHGYKILVSDWQSSIKLVT